MNKDIILIGANGINDSFSELRHLYLRKESIQHYTCNCTQTIHAHIKIYNKIYKCNVIWLNETNPILKTSMQRVKINVFGVNMAKKSMIKLLDTFPIKIGDLNFYACYNNKTLTFVEY